MAEFDGIVIGAGHNGLTVAAYLARAGLRIAVLERNNRIGGGCSTDPDILPGFRLNLHANFYMGMSHCPLIEDLELYRYGQAIYQRERCARRSARRRVRCGHHQHN